LNPRKKQPDFSQISLTFSRHPKYPRAAPKGTPMKIKTHIPLPLQSYSTALIALALMLAVCGVYAQSTKTGPKGAPDQVATPDSWAAGANLPGPLVRAVGVFFPTNGFFYAIGGRSADTAGSDSVHPFEYNPGTNTWTTKASSFPDNQMNNMACGVLTVGGTPQIYCVGGSAAGATTATARVFSYNPVSDTITSLTVADNWPGNAGGTILPGGFAVVANKLYIVGGFNINTAMTQGTWEFDPNAAIGSRWVQKLDYPVQRGYVPTAAIGGLIYTAGGALWDGTTLQDTADSFKFDPVANTWTAITNTPRAGGETRALTVNNRMWVMGGGRVAPNPSTEVDVYNPTTNAWSLGTPFATPRRNFPTDTNGSRVWLAGGYTTDGLTPQQTMEIFSVPAAQTAFSRKMHGATNFDIPLPLSGTAGIECRSSGGAHTIIVNFASAVTVSGATVTSGTGTVGTATASGSQVTVTLTGVTNAQTITVTLNNVNDGTSSGDVPVSMGVLAGDTNANGSVSSADVSQTKSRIGLTVDATNFRSDVNVSGSFTASDVSLVKSGIGTGLP
jgi:N-acetylneuraminic acid mutarotase